MKNYTLKVTLKYIIYNYIIYIYIIYIYIKLFISNNICRTYLKYNFIVIMKSLGLFIVLIRPVLMLTTCITGK